MNGLVQVRCKWLFWVKFFTFKSAWIFACAFQFSRKTFSCIIFRLKCSCSALLHSLCTLWYLVFIFLRNKVQTSQKKVWENVLLLNWKAHVKIQALLKEKQFTRKSYLRLSCTKPFNCWMVTLWYLSSSFWKLLLLKKTMTFNVMRAEHLIVCSRILFFHVIMNFFTNMSFKNFYISCGIKKPATLP